MPYRDFVAFMVKQSISPLHSRRADYHTAMLLQQTAGLNHNEKEYGKFDPSLSRFLPFSKLDNSPSEMSLEDLEELDRKIDASYARAQQVRPDVFR
jgi:hypothetical protein